MGTATMNLYDELLGLVDVLGEHGIDYAICGGLALALHGHPRMTTDIDLLVRGEDLDRVRNAVRAVGFTIDSGRIPFRLGRPDEQFVHRMLKVRDRQALTLDLMVLPSFLEDVWRGRSAIAWQGRTVQVVSRQGLARMKRLAGRKQDLADLEVLESPGHGDDGPT